jgi:hypothetical protein
MNIVVIQIKAAVFQIQGLMNIAAIQITAVIIQLKQQLLRLQK